MASVEESKEKILQIALKDLGRSENDLQAELDSLKEWFKTQKHLPEIPDDHILINQILSNKFHMEKTKKKIDTYYTIRSILPEIFENSNPNRPSMKSVLKQIAVFPLGVTESGHRVGMFWMDLDKNDRTISPYNVASQIINSIEVMAHESITLPWITIHDYGKLTTEYLTKINPVTIKKTFVPLKMFSIRQKEIHIVNIPKYAEIFLNMYKQFFIPKIRDRVSYDVIIFYFVLLINEYSSLSCTAHRTSFKNIYQNHFYRWIMVEIYQT
ncbi:unnamed protein product [Acanthoscelides obtectus]|uniref:CRAL-TRIO domain-containing protein n=1 Tax=Acanthoscelides obtectus TaxID=200917 RepID=A0A9P0PV63_ACAOB|nr:unnamed protein product [Acanthoscelides obtectus]CAK1659647.1 Retinol-binding protein pinta [Acanthoscelides obtectus]